MRARCATRVEASTRLRSKRWQRDSTVTGTLRISVVAKMNFTCGGGSSSVLRKALKAPGREHMHFVDDVDLVARRSRRVAHAVGDLAHILDAVVRGGVDLHHIDMIAFDDRRAMQAEAVEIDGRRAAAVRQLIIQPARQDARRRRLADAAHAREHPGLGDAVVGEGVAQGAHHRVLPDQIGEARRAVFARQHAIAREARGRGEGAKPGSDGSSTPCASAGSASLAGAEGGVSCIAHVPMRSGRLDEDPLGPVRAASFRT